MEQHTLTETRAAVTAALAALRGLGGVLYQGGSGEVSDFMGELDALGAWVEAAKVTPLGEATARGVVAESHHASATDWVLARCPSLSAGDAARLVAVTQACALPRHEVLAEAVRGARVSCRDAAVVLSEFARIAPRLAEGAAGPVLAGFVAVAESHDPKQVRRLRQAMLARWGAPGELQDEQDRLARTRSLSAPLTADDGLAEYRLRLDPEGCAILEGVLGPLAAPLPTADSPDLRSSETRRADALLEVCRRATAAGGDAPATVKTQLVVTLDYATLKDALTASSCGHDGCDGTCRDGGRGDGRSGDGSGSACGPGGRLRAGLTLTGNLLAPGTLRRLACDAGITPVVLGAHSEVLDVGRTRRLVTPAQLKALYLRDAGCTFPGCTRHPQWCDAHHVRHWADGGPTDLLNLALLCGRHHSIVHQRGLTATITTTGVTWHT